MRTDEQDGSTLLGDLNVGLGNPEVSVDTGSTTDQPHQPLAFPASLSRCCPYSASDTTPSWVTELATSTHSRPSRASSIISTHTLTSITTVDGPQSIDVVLGRENFRITRDGSLIDITRDESPAPPYDAPFIPATSITFEEAVTRNHQTPGSADDQVGSPAPAYASVSSMEHFSTMSLETLVPPNNSELDWTTPSPPIRPGGQERNRTPSPLEDGAGVSRSPSYIPGKESLAVDRRRSSLSSVPLGESPESARAGLRRRNGIRLKLVTKTSGETHGQNVSPLSPGSGGSSMSAVSRYTTSAGTTPVQDDNRSRPSSLFPVAQQASANIPSMASRSEDDSPCKRRRSQPNITAQDPPYIEESFVETAPPPPMDTEDEIKIHYNRLLRSIDRNYRKELHARDDDMSKLRERINEMDQVYRMELRARDQELEDRIQARDRDLNQMHKRLKTLEQQDHAAIDRAQNEVEDMWEVKWKDRDRHLMERMRRIEQENQEQVEKAVEENNKKWEAEWTKRNEELLERLRKAEGNSASPHGKENNTSFLYSLRL